ncbi:DeoR/GlpR family DNA-binding transcription regulator [Pseudalkalibacillus caeni]|uniref:DeoR/GlpR transcriptional regulator n=1 Tax=Exobacillus caeni TaxID=2574798 RepID=A0A5R9FER0_9BACL|nr:DeoR/GlpR family DNA-binding transcription regulator [Pseudalkalibacillus caeni]TLS39064.1 DeoR/GlpR transcriptional regulator [Pseudalkalibacillus caeni]
MLTPERQQIILELLKTKNVVTVHEMCEATDASVSTIRRDLAQLESEEKLRRVHGGASRLHSKITEPTVMEKSAKNISEKKAIASYAASLVENGDCVYLDAGTSTMQMVPFLRGKDIVVVTNGFHLIDPLIKNEIETYILGGKMKVKTGAVVGAKALDSIETYRFDKSFIGINGIHEKYGYTTPDPEEAIMKRKAIGLSQKSYILADHSKLKEVTFSKVAEISEASIITSYHEKDELKQLKSLTTVEVVRK